MQAVDENRPILEEQLDGIQILLKEQLESCQEHTERIREQEEEEEDWRRAQQAQMDNLMVQLEDVLKSQNERRSKDERKSQQEVQPGTVDFLLELVRRNHQDQLSAITALVDEHRGRKERQRTELSGEGAKQKRPLKSSSSK